MASTVFLAIGAVFILADRAWAQDQYCTQVADLALKTMKAGSFDHPTYSRRNGTAGEVVFYQSRSIDRDREGKAIQGGNISHFVVVARQTGSGGSIVGTAKIHVRYPAREDWEGQVLDVRLNQDCTVSSVYYNPARASNIQGPAFRVTASTCKALAGDLGKIGAIERAMLREVEAADARQNPWQSVHAICADFAPVFETPESIAKSYQPTYTVVPTAPEAN